MNAPRGRERLADCPDQSGENSLEPAASAATLIDAVALPAVGNAGASGDIGPISRTIRFARPRAGRPVNTLVSTVASSRASSRAARCRSDIADSALGRYAVPICTPAAPRAKAAAIPRPSAMPPAATTGTSTASTTCGTSAMVPGWESTVSVRNMPRWPPASYPCAITASHPRAASQRASATVVAELSTLQPSAFTRSSRRGSGSPK